MLDNVVQTKICTKCKVEFPATSEFFNKNNRYKGGFQYNCKACMAIYAKNYRGKNSEKINATAKQYYKDNSERIMARVKQYREGNSEGETARRKKWRKANPEKVNKWAKANPEYLKQWKEANPEYHSQWAKANPEKCCIIARRRNAIKKSLISDFTIKQWEDCLLYFDHKDAYTGLPMDNPSQDHVIPVSKGGNYTVSNIIPCERSINSSKGNKNMLTWFRKQAYYDVERENRILGYVRNNQITERLGA